MQLECWGKNANVLLRERFNATDSSFQCPLRSFFFLDVNVWQLFLQLITSKFIDGLPHIFGIILQRVDHASNDQRELDFKGSWFRPVLIAWY